MKNNNTIKSPSKKDPRDFEISREGIAKALLEFGPTTHLAFGLGVLAYNEGTISFPKFLGAMRIIDENYYTFLKQCDEYKEMGEEPADYQNIPWTDVVDVFAHEGATPTAFFQLTVYGFKERLITRDQLDHLLQAFAPDVYEDSKDLSDQKVRDQFFVKVEPLPASKA